MKHIASHQFSGTSLGTLGRSGSGLQWPIRMAMAAAAAVGRRFPSAPSRITGSGSAGVPTRSTSGDRRRAARRVSATRWDGLEPRGLPLVEGLAFAVVMAYFAAGLLAILGGL